MGRQNFLCGMESLSDWLNVLTHAEKAVMEWLYTILFILYVLKMAGSHSLHVAIECAVVVAGQTVDCI